VDGCRKLKRGEIFADWKSCHSIARAYIFLGRYSVCACVKKEKNEGKESECARGGKKGGIEIALVR